VAKESQRLITDHLIEFCADLTSRQNTPKHVRMTRQHILWVTEQSDISTPTEITRPRVTKTISQLHEDGASLRTCNAYLRSIKSFTRWLLAEKRIPDDRLTGIKQFNEATDRRLERRPFLAEEIAELLRSTQEYSTGNHGLTGTDRAMLYRVALGTGFRTRELRSLTPESFDLDGTTPQITVEAAYSKRRRRDVQTIRADLADELRPWLATKPQNKLIFERMAKATARMLRTDLIKARNKWIAAAVDQEERLQREESDFLRHVDSSGKVLDFHAIRHTYISGIVAGNASVKVAQELARHSTARLTVDRYSHIGTQEKVEALDGLRLGTLPQNGMHIWQHTARETVQSGATGCEQPHCATKNADDPKSKESHALDTLVPHDATGCDERRRRDSNPGWRICNPLP